MRNVKTIYVLVVLIFCGVIFHGCGKNPSSPKAQNFYDFSVIVVDESGNPLKGVNVTTFPGTTKRVTNREGRVFFENILEGDYQIVLSRSDIPIFYRDYRLTKRSIKEWKFVIASSVTINIYVKDILGQPLNGMHINTSPVSMTTITDEDGYAVLKNVPVRRYTFIIKRSNTTFHIKDKALVIINGQPQDIEIIIDSQLPFVKILAPENRSSHNVFDIHLSGEGYDFEDGELPENAFTWYSESDGVLGTGRELTVDRLSTGWNKITLKGVDSDGNFNETSIYLDLFHYEEDSYFPAPLGACWKYRYKNPALTFLNNEGEKEYWNFSELEVSIDEENTRSCLINYTVCIKNRIKRYRYYVVDSYDIADDTISLSKTVEELNIWRTMKEDAEPVEQLNIETVYSPGYIVLKNQMDFLENDSYTNNVSADITWRYFDAFEFSKRYNETIEIETTIETGGTERIETEIGAFDATTLTMYCENSVRKWWLAKGIGMVQIEYNTYDFPLSATLCGTNIAKYSEENQLYKRVSIMTDDSCIEFREEIPLPTHSPERMLEVCRILRELCPR